MIKRMVDFSASLIGLIILAPVFLICAITIKHEDKGSVFFAQTRVGKGRKPFRIYKFRTMGEISSYGESFVTTAHDIRITRVGKILRKWKLDELPQLFNVLKGEMSLVGPRPEVPKLFRKYPRDLQIIMSDNHPGMTDFASIEYFNESRLIADTDNAEQVYLDQVLRQKSAFIKKYAKVKSFKVDMIIIFRTFIKILS